MNKKIGVFVEHIAESASACLLTMVQGNLLALTLSHWLIATQTGLIAGVLASAAILFARISRPWVISAVVGLVTAVVDYFVHSGALAAVLLEAAITGLGAGVLAYLVGSLLRFTRARRTAAQ